MDVHTATRYLVSGRVQGVWFRQSTQSLANRLGLRGWVRNLPDGRVEVVAAGAELAQLAAWLQQGPELARVERVESETVQCELPQGFELRY